MLFFEFDQLLFNIFKRTKKILMKLNYFVEMLDRKNCNTVALFLASTNSQRFSPSQTFDTVCRIWPVQDLSFGFVKWSWSITTITTPQRLFFSKLSLQGYNLFCHILLYLHISGHNYGWFNISIVVFVLVRLSVRH